MPRALNRTSISGCSRTLATTSALALMESSRTRIVILSAKRVRKRLSSAALLPPPMIAMGLRKPRWPVLGQELAGEIEAVGKNVKRFKRGDQVFASLGLGFGAHAEYKCLSSNGPIAIKPANMSYEEAAGIPVGGDNALHFLRKADIQGGESVLVNGAGGNIGVMAVQLAKHFGADVTAVDSTEKLDMLREIGADHVIDYTKEDFTKSGESYDVIFDLVHNSAYSRCVRSLKPNGRYLLVNPSLFSMVRGRCVDTK